MHAMSDESARLYTSIRCPVCAAPMRLLAIMPKSTGADEITYRCEICKVERQQMMVRERVELSEAAGGRAPLV